MDTREYFVECFKAERPKFLRVLRAVPADKAKWRPHPNSSSAEMLVWLLAAELDDACKVLDRGRVNHVETKPPGTLAESIEAYERNADELEKRLARTDEAAWRREAELLMDGKLTWETTAGDMLFGFLFDAIHHRGQLSSYLRPMGAKVPAIYGPSGDDPGT